VVLVVLVSAVVGRSVDGEGAVDLEVRSRLADACATARDRRDFMSFGGLGFVVVDFVVLSLVIFFRFLFEGADAGTLLGVEAYNGNTEEMRFNE